jgi:hypothetical protein
MYRQFTPDSLAVFLAEEIESVKDRSKLFEVICHEETEIGDS